MSHAQTRKSESIYDRVTNQIIEAIEAGASSKGYRMPWHIGDAEAFSPVNAVSKRPYHGVNVLSLWLAAERRGYASGPLGDVQAVAGTRRPGEGRGEILPGRLLEGFRPRVTTGTTTEAKTGRGEERHRSGEAVARCWPRDIPLFNLAQVDGYTPPETPCLSKSERNAAAEKFFADARGGRPARRHRGLL